MASQKERGNLSHENSEADDLARTGGYQYLFCLLHAPSPHILAVSLHTETDKLINYTEITM